MKRFFLASRVVGSKYCLTRRGKGDGLSQLHETVTADKSASPLEWLAVVRFGLGGLTWSHDAVTESTRECLSSSYSGLQFDSNISKKHTHVFLFTCGARHLGSNLQ